LIDSLSQEVSEDQNKAMRQLRATLSKRKHNVSYKYRDSTEWEEDADEISLSRVFEILGSSLIPEYTVRLCGGLMAVNIRKDDTRGSSLIPLNEMKELLAELMALDLVAPSTVRHSVKDNEEYWSLTPLGTDYLKWSKRKRLETVAVSETESDAAIAERASKESIGHDDKPRASGEAISSLE
jgi:hypothetical protein